MNSKAFFTLELNKVLDRLARHTSFSAGQELALNLYPTPRLADAQLLMQETTEARILLEDNPEQFTLGGVHDVREAVLSTIRGVVLEPNILLDIRSTLRRATTIRRLLGRMKHTYTILGA